MFSNKKVRLLLEDENKRSDAPFINIQSWSSDSRIDRAASLLVEAFALGRESQRKIQTKKYLKVAKVLILNLIRTYGKTRYLGYGRSPRPYKINRYNPYKIKVDTITQLVDWLHSEKYVKNYIADSGAHISKASRVKANERFWKLIELDPITPIKHEYHEKFEPIILKETKGEGKRTPFKKYVDTPTTISMRAFLHSYNELRKRTELEIDGQIKELGAVVRIFNGDFESGGRFYWGIETEIKRELRTGVRAPIWRL